ncbi:carbohydrate kinase family protein [Caulobacter mirabilis]|uniref:Carbohydrate kinase family protein n=1 Tax=Caulobacter mirabilis TaxID=69666 RepID=A0A2D2B0W3_9CAUL|nr:carbohydrate kinase family protein [Caulobacter mirabilis]ATQ43847.1 carbohydrate kinase family protein [Caulobacter mirabilis]
MLTIIGDVSVDLVLGPVDGWPAVGTELLMERSEFRPGGSGGNAALAARWLGARARVYSMVGGDPLGGWLSAQFGDLEACLSVSEAATSVSTGVIHSCGERTFFTTRGHLERLSWADIRPHLQPAPSANSIALLTGAFLLPRLRVDYSEIVAFLRDLGYGLAIDTGWPPGGWTDRTRAEASRWIAACDHVLLNEVEITGLAGEPDLGRAMDALSTLLRPGATLVAKTGPKGAIGRQNGRAETHLAPPVAVFDTIGAGDSFNAGYLLSRQRGDGLQSALRAGCAAAAAIISRFPRQDIRPGELADRGLLTEA